MADLTRDQAHIMRKLIEPGYDHCIACGQYPEPILKQLCDRGWMENIYDSVYRLTLVGKGVTLRDLRGA